MNIQQACSFISKRSKVRHFRKLVKKYIAEFERYHPDDSDYEKKVRSYFKKILPYYNNTDWHRFYQRLNNNKSIWYVPEDIYYLAIEPYLVNYDLFLAYVDKNNYDKWFGTSNHPETILRYMNRNFYGSEYELINEQEGRELILNCESPLVVKPTIRETGGGKGLFICNTHDEKKSITDFLKKKNDDYIIQKKIIQSEQLSVFNSSSVNTFRILTLRHENKIIPLSSIARFGRNTSVTDNITCGGVFIHVNHDGSLPDFGFGKPYDKIFHHPDSKVPFKRTSFTGYVKAEKLCLERHTKLPYFDLISWDVTLDQNNEPIMVELNLKNQEINFHQITSGPLFGKYSEEIIRKAIENLKKTRYTLFSL